MKLSFLTSLALLATSFISVQAADWMYMLPDEAPVCRVTIPGTHDSATGNGFTGFLGLLVGNSSAKTQDLSMAEQWEAGIRAFDLRPAGNDLALYHGVCQTQLKFNEAIELFCNSLDAHPNEFVFITMRKEDDGDAATWASKVQTVLSNERYSTYLVPFRSDLTVGEARGKIIVVSRDAFSIPAAGMISGWNHGADLSAQKGAAISCGGRTARLYAQDFYECTGEGAGALKQQAIKAMYGCSSALTPTDDIWVLNHTSGYTTSASSDGNRNCASLGATAMLEALASGEPGPAGIVLMDFAGVDQSGNYDTRGLELINALIQHNSRYDLVGSSEPIIKEPTVSTPDTYFWHTISTPLREYRTLTAPTQTEGGIMGETEKQGERSQWRLEQRADGTLDIINRASGAYISPVDQGGQLYTVATQPAAGWAITKADTDGLYTIHSGSNVQFNQANSSNDYKLLNWGAWYGSFNTTDDGCQFEFRVVDTSEGPGSGIGTLTADPQQPTAIYDLQGRRLPSATAPGLYIINRRKTLVRQ